MPTEKFWGNSFEYLIQQGSEQLMVDICGFWAVPHPGLEDSFKLYKPFQMSAHTMVAWLRKIWFYPNVRQFQKLIFFWSSPCLHWNECKSLIFSGTKFVSHFHLVFAGNYKKWRNSMLCIKYFETIVLVIPLLLWGKSVSHYPKIPLYVENCRDLVLLILAYCFSSFLKHALRN